MDKKISEIAKDLGVSKDKVRYQVRKLPTNYLGKLPNGTVTVNSNGIRIIREKMSKVSPASPGDSTHLITYLERLVEQQQEQMIHLQKLLENQQVLTLKAQERVQLLETQKEEQETEIIEEEPKKKWQFWK